MLDSYLIHEDVNIIYTNDLGNEGTKREKNGQKLWFHIILAVRMHKTLSE